MFKKLRKNKKGFTLIELIVVVAILAILAAVAVPNFMGMTKKAEIATEVAAAAELANAINIHNTIAAGGVGTAVDGTDDLDDVKGKLGTDATGLYPEFDADEDNVFARITISYGIATVTEKGELPTTP